MRKKQIVVEGKALPHSEDVEQIVLGTIIIDGSVMDRISKDFSINLFYNQENIEISKTIIDLYKASLPIDLVTLVKKLKDTDRLEQAGGINYVSNLSTRVSGSANIEFHIKILQEESLRRKVILISNKAIVNSFDDTNDIFEVFSNTQHQFDDAIKNVVNYEIKKVGQIHSDVISQSISVLKSGTKSGVPTGLRLLDNVTNGWQKSDLIVLAGRPGMGKTSCVVSMAIHPSVFMDIPIAIFSLEMSSEQLVARMQSQFSMVNVSKIVKKQLTEDEIVKIERSTEKFRESPMYVDDTPNISLMDLKGKVRKLVRENEVKLVIIDYLQLMRSGLKTQSREQEIAEISRGLKALAKELSIPIIALSQLSRSVEQRGGDKKPLLSDLRESGAIEQDADMVLFCWRPEYYGQSEYEVGGKTFPCEGLFMLIVAKHRNGELGEIPLKFIHEQTKVTNYEDNFTTFEQRNEHEEYVPVHNLKPNLEFSTQLSPMELDDFDTSNQIDENPF
jgi:replicative DNA helicase